jgi:hypothetical protein
MAKPEGTGKRKHKKYSAISAADVWAGHVGDDV